MHCVVAEVARTQYQHGAYEYEDVLVWGERYTAAVVVAVAGACFAGASGGVVGISAQVAQGPFVSDVADSLSCEVAGLTSARSLGVGGWV
jgi:hypothetical protein